MGSRGAVRMWGLPRGASRETGQEKALAWGWKASLNLGLFGDKPATTRYSWLCLTVTVGRCSVSVPTPNIGHR